MSTWWYLLVSPAGDISKSNETVDLIVTINFCYKTSNDVKHVEVYKIAVW